MNFNKLYTYFSSLVDDHLPSSSLLCGSALVERLVIIRQNLKQLSYQSHIIIDSFIIQRIL